MAMNKLRGTLLLAVLVLLTAGNAHSQESSQDQSTSPPARPAEVMTMSLRDITLEKSYPAKLRSNSEATVIARVRGVLEARHFQSGQLVTRGDRLYTIEPDVYQAAVNQQKANLQSAEAKAIQATRNAKRASTLRKQHAISQQDAEETIAQGKVAEASVAQAKASLEAAQIDLRYTQVKAPVTGRVGLSQVNLGNVVDSGTVLVTITPLDPLEVRFELPQRDAFELRRQRKFHQATVAAVLEFPGLENGTGTLKGSIDFLGFSVNQKTSTIAAQAVFSNPDGLFLPGQFVRIHLEGLKRYQVLAVPEIAVTQGLLGPQVFTLNKDNVTTASNVTLGDEAGSEVIITAGLEVGDRVVVSDPGAIDAGMKIKPQAPKKGNADDSSGPAQQSQSVKHTKNDNAGAGRKTGSADAADGGGGQ